MSAARLSAKQKTEIVEAYKARTPIAVIAERYGVSLSYPGILAKRHGHAARHPEISRACRARRQADA